MLLYCILVLNTDGIKSPNIDLKTNGYFKICQRPINKRTPHPHVMSPSYKH